MNADQGDMTLDSPEALREKTSGLAAAVASISTPMSVERPDDWTSAWKAGPLARRHLIAHHLAGLEREDAAPDDALAVLAARVDDRRAADGDQAARLVDVAG